MGINMGLQNRLYGSELKWIIHSYGKCVRIHGSGLFKIYDSLGKKIDPSTSSAL